MSVPDPRTHVIAPRDETTPHAYWACERPEVPGEYGVSYSWECDGCYFALLASVRTGAGKQPSGSLGPNKPGELQPFDLEAVQAYRRERGMFT